MSKSIPTSPPHRKAYSSESVMPRKALVIDDDLRHTRRSKRLLRLLGLEAISCSSQDDVPGQIEKHGCDLCLIDLFMPKVDGIELISTLRQCRKNFLIISCSAGWLSPTGRYVDLLESSVSLGANASLRKPFNKADLWLAIQTAAGVIDDAQVIHSAPNVVNWPRQPT